MPVSKKMTFKNFKDEDISLSDFVANKLNGSDYERSSSEGAAVTANNCKNAMANLIEVLQEKIGLTREEIKRILRDV